MGDTSSINHSDCQCSWCRCCVSHAVTSKPFNTVTKATLLQSVLLHWIISLIKPQNRPSKQAGGRWYNKQINWTTLCLVIHIITQLRIIFLSTWLKHPKFALSAWIHARVKASGTYKTGITFEMHGGNGTDQSSQTEMLIYLRMEINNNRPIKLERNKTTNYVINGHIMSMCSCLYTHKRHINCGFCILVFPIYTCIFHH